MTNSLKLLFEAINQVHAEQEMRSLLIPKIREHFAAERSGIFFFDRLKADRNFQQILNVALSIERNPIARYIAEHHAPVHEGLVTSPKTWAIVCPRPDHWHVMAGPIVERGQVVGAVGCTRSKSGQAFHSENLADLSAICLHLSVWTATVRFAQNPTAKLEERPAFCSDRLTSRELQIAQLVALDY
jgi:GAF domain-containing protein